MLLPDFLIIGTYPPPIGGVSVHIQRFFEHVQDKGLYSLGVLDLKRRRLKVGAESHCGWWVSIRSFFKAKLIHVQISNHAKYYIIILAFLLRKKILYTHHNAIVRSHFGFCLILALVDRMIVVNPIVLKGISNLSKVVVIPAFIPPLVVPKLRGDISAFIKKKKIIIAINAYALNYYEGKEVYGIDVFSSAIQLLIHKSLKDLNDLAVVFFDPSDSYGKHPEWNALIREAPLVAQRFSGNDLSFYSLLQNSSFCVRATRTDGDPLSIREALNLDVRVVASDSVDRPLGVITYSCENAKDLANVLYEEIISFPLGEEFSVSKKNNKSAMEYFLMLKMEYDRFC